MKPLSLQFQLLDWSETKRGRKVIFEVLNDPETPTDVHPFAAYTARNGKVAGQYFATVLVEFDPATGAAKEPPTQLSVEPAPAETRPLEAGDPRLAMTQSFDRMLLSQQAAILCKDPDFQKWLQFEAGYPNATDEKGAKEAVCCPMGLTSRSQLDTNAQAASYFREWLEDFFEWRAKQCAVTITKPSGSW